MVASSFLTYKVLSLQIALGRGRRWWGRRRWWWWRWRWRRGCSLVPSWLLLKLHTPGLSCHISPSSTSFVATRYEFLLICIFNRRLFSTFHAFSRWKWIMIKRTSSKRNKWKSRLRATLDFGRVPMHFTWVNFLKKKKNLHSKYKKINKSKRKREREKERGKGRDGRMDG